MLDTVGRYMQGLSNLIDASFLGKVINPLADRMSSQALNNAGLVINAGGATFPKIGATDFYALAGGVLVKVAAGTGLPALTGINVPAGNFNVACYYVDSAGTLTVLGGTPAATIGAIVWPQTPVKKAMIGFLLITYASAFTGGTTPLDTATTVYINMLGPCDPTVLL